MTITGTGSISTMGDESDGIYAMSEGNVSVTTGEVSTAGDFSSGIEAVGPGTVTVVSGEVTTAGDRSAGIVAHQESPEDHYCYCGPPGLIPAAALGLAGGVSVTSGAVVTTGDFSVGIDALATTGDIEIVSGSISTAGYESDGIYADAALGNISIESGDIATLGQELAERPCNRRNAGTVSIVHDGVISTAGKSRHGPPRQRPGRRHHHRLRLDLDDRQSGRWHRCL